MNLKQAYLKLFIRNGVTDEKKETKVYNRYYENLIHTFIKNKDGMWANIEINTYDDIHWDADSPSFKYEKLFYIENKNYAVGLLDRKYADSADSMPLEYLGEDFDFLYRLTLVYYEGGLNDYRMAVDDIVDVYDNRYIVAKKNTFNEPKIGLFKIIYKKWGY